MDLIIADIPENLPVPTVSIPSSTVPSWNSRESGYVESIFEFASYYLQNDGALLLFHCDDRDLCTEVFDLADSYDFVMTKDWWGINDLSLASPRDPTSTVFSTSIRRLCFYGTKSTRRLSFFTALTSSFFLSPHILRLIAVYTVLDSRIHSWWRRDIQILISNGELRDVT